MQPVRELDDDDADVVGDREEHLAQVLRLPVLAREHPCKVGICELCNAVHHPGDVLAEELGDLLDTDVHAILDRVVEQAGDDRIRVHLHLNEDDRDGLRVDVIGLERFALLPGMDRLRKVDRFGQ